MRLTALLILSLLATSYAAPQNGNGDSGNGDDDDGRGRGGGDDDGGGDDRGRDGDDGGVTGTGVAASAASSTASADAPTQSGSGSTLPGTTGDSTCNTFMCIAAAVNDSTVTYVLQSTGALSLGWMGMGFGTQMANTPMVVLWSNPDGTITLSQRIAPGEVMPTLDPDPPAVASLQVGLSDLTGSQPKFVYSIPTPSQPPQPQQIIWAYGLQNPQSSSPDAEFLHHLAAGTATLDLAKPIVEGDGGLNPASGGGGNTGSGGGDGAGDGSGNGTTGEGGGNAGAGTGNVTIPLLYYQRLIIAHAILLTLAFLLFLPLGALLARFLRTRTPSWFRAHFVLQLAVAGPLVIAGLALGVESVRRSSGGGGAHLDSVHKRWGVGLVVMYFVQVILGLLVHLVKPRLSSSSAYPTSSRRTVLQYVQALFIRPGRRPVQNYVHAVLGLGTIGVAFYQVRTGYETEWVRATGRERVPVGVGVVWYLWIVLLPLLYALGLFLLPKQLRQERTSRVRAFADSNRREHTRSNSGARLLGGGGGGSGDGDGMAEVAGGGGGPVVVGAGVGAGVGGVGRRKGDRERERNGNAVGDETGNGNGIGAITVSRPTRIRRHSNRSQRDRDRGDRPTEHTTRRPSNKRHHSSRSERERERERERPSASRRPSAGERRPSAGERRPSAGERRPSAGVRRPSARDKERRREVGGDEVLVPIPTST